MGSKSQFHTQVSHTTYFGYFKNHAMAKTRWIDEGVSLKKALDGSSGACPTAELPPRASLD